MERGRGEEKVWVERGETVERGRGEERVGVWEGEMNGERKRRGESRGGER